MNALMLMLGRQIAYSREELGLTQKELAEKADVSLQTIKFIERGRTFPKLTTLDLIAKVLGYDLIDFLCLVEKRERRDKAENVNLTALRDRKTFLNACRDNPESVCDKVIFECFHTIYSEWWKGDLIDENGEVVERCDCTENWEAAYALAELALKIKDSTKHNKT